MPGDKLQKQLDNVNGEFFSALNVAENVLD